MDPATIALLASSVVAGINAVTQLVKIQQNPASTPEQKAAALAGANAINAACVQLNAIWASLSPEAKA